MTVRTRNETEKTARRQAIVAVATQSLGKEGSSADVTMAVIAQRCGLAKGTLYLYYETKEELLLATLESELSNWYAAIASEVQRRGSIDACSFSAVVLDALAQREALAELLPRLRLMLEDPAMPRQSVAGFRDRINERLATTADAVERALDLPRGTGACVVLRTQALVAGLHQLRDPEIESALPTTGTTRADSDLELMSAITAIVRGMFDAVS